MQKVISQWKKWNPILFGPVTFFPIYMCYDMRQTSKMENFWRKYFFLRGHWFNMRVVIGIKIFRSGWISGKNWKFLSSEFWCLTLSRCSFQQAGTDNSHGWYCCAKSGQDVPWRYVTFGNEKNWTTKCQHKKLSPLWKPDIEREHSLC